MFKDAFLEMNCTEFFSETYPLLGEYIDEYGFTQDLVIKFIEKAINNEGKNYQNCLNDLINIILDGARYSLEGFDDVIKCIKYLLLKDCIFPEEKIFDARYKITYNSKEKIKPTYEDEIFDYHIRGKLIDNFHSNMNIIDNINWSQISAKYWEDLDNKNEITDEKRYSYLKYCSEYLANTYPNIDDSLYK